MTSPALLDRWAQPGSQATPADELQGSAKLDTDAAAAERPPTPAFTHGTAGTAILAPVTLDGVPENVALGVSLSEGTSTAAPRWP
jgi:ZIP family zinc transporter